MDNELKGKVSRTIYTAKVEYTKVMIDEGQPYFSNLVEAEFISASELDEIKILDLIKEKEGNPGPWAVLSIDSSAQVYALPWNKFLEIADPIERPKSQRRKENK